MSDEQWEWGKEGVSLCALLELLDNCGFLAVILSFPQREKCIENISLQKVVNNKVAAFVDRTGLFKAEIIKIFKAATCLLLRTEKHLHEYI